MKIHRLHPWNVTPQGAVRIQEQVRRTVIPHGRTSRSRLIAGADAAFDLERHLIFAAVVVLSFPGFEVVETVVHHERLRFRYIPGLLAFRESLCPAPGIRTTPARS